MISIIRRLHGFQRTMSTIKIGTHNGHFHCDEIFACFLLKTLPQYANAEIVRFVVSVINGGVAVSGENRRFSFRSRDPKVLAECHTVVDVGGVFDAAQRRYDHHQKYEFHSPCQTSVLQVALVCSEHSPIHFIRCNQRNRGRSDCPVLVLSMFIMVERSFVNYWTKRISPIKTRNIWWKFFSINSMKHSSKRSMRSTTAWISASIWSQRNRLIVFHTDHHGSVYPI